MPNGGWVKVYRKISENGFFRKSEYVHLWLHLLLEAAHEPVEFVWNGQTMTLQPGQLLTGRTELVKKTGIAGTNIERILDYFQNEQQIGQQKTNKFRIITITNWSDYQQIGQQSGQQTDNKRTTNGQHKDTYKNEKKEKKEKKKTLVNTLSDEEWLTQLSSNSAYAGIDIQQQYGKMRTWCEVNHKTPSRRRFVNWLNRAEKPLKAIGGELDLDTPIENRKPIVYQTKSGWKRRNPDGTEEDCDPPRRDTALRGIL